MLRDIDYIQAAWQQPGAEAIRSLGYPAPAGKAASSFCSTSGEAQAGDEHDSCMSALQPQHLSFTGDGPCARGAYVGLCGMCVLRSLMMRVLVGTLANQQCHRQDMAVRLSPGLRQMPGGSLGGPAE